MIINTHYSEKKTYMYQNSARLQKNQYSVFWQKVHNISTGIMCLS